VHFDAMRQTSSIAAIVVVAGICLSALVGTASARTTQRAETPPCKAITDKILNATSARFEQFSELGTRVLFEHPSARDLSLSCTSPQKIGVFVRWDSAEPPAAFFDLATKAGVATTGELMSTLGMAIRNCHRAALQGSTEFAVTETPMSKVECQAFRREGGGASVSVWVK
jgi:hypothetical protein